MWWKNVKFTIMLSVICVVILILVIGAWCGRTRPAMCRGVLIRRGPTCPYILCNVASGSDPDLRHWRVWRRWRWQQQPHAHADHHGPVRDWLESKVAFFFFACTAGSTCTVRCTLALGPTKVAETVSYRTTDGGACPGSWGKT